MCLTVSLYKFMRRFDLVLYAVLFMCLYAYTRDVMIWACKLFLPTSDNKVCMTILYQAKFRYEARLAPYTHEHDLGGL